MIYLVLNLMYLAPFSFVQNADFLGENLCNFFLEKRLTNSQECGIIGISARGDPSRADKEGVGLIALLPIIIITYINYSVKSKLKSLGIMSSFAFIVSPKCQPFLTFSLSSIRICLPPNFLVQLAFVVPYFTR